MIGAVLFAVTLYVFTTELWLFVTRRSRRAVLRQARAAGSGGQTLSSTCRTGFSVMANRW
jgi:uncharacterized membrane protein